ncbi:MAG: LodA/GoxA family CTQ-dependent oxidase [Bryobacterales bacterium]|nr:LodA/GoxA family CTQ-dependent oxidase [Bryobacterales bacterium]
MQSALAYCRIHPAIGIARIGNSPAEYFLGPESVDYNSIPAGGYKDPGEAAAPCLPRIKRQAVRFRVYGFDSAGACLGEITTESAKSMEWTVELANTKASYRRTALADNRDPEPRRARLRNKGIPADQRWKLNITPHARTLIGPSQTARFDDGRFMDIPVSLGEIQTDAQGRLIVLGGSGKAGAYDAAKRLKTSTDNDGWYDDVSDGPLTATVTLADGRIIMAAPAWVVVAHPDFAPALRHTVTEYDVFLDLARRRGVARPSARPSFAREIYPLLDRIAGKQWLDRRALMSFGNIQTQWRTLSQNVAGARQQREAVFADVSRHYMHGKDDAAQDSWLQLTPTQYQILKRWSEGEFESDWQPDASERSESIPFTPLPDDLDRAALDSYAGGILSAHLLDGQAPDIFLPGELLRLDHGKLAAGDLTKGMPCPWQAGFLNDAAACPKEVLGPKTYKDLCAIENQIAALPKDGTGEEVSRVLRERRDSLWLTRETWARGLGDEFPARAERLVHEWPHLGFVACGNREGRRFRWAERPCFVETERSEYLGTMAEYFHRLVNIECNRDFTAKAMELALQMLGDAKFSSDPKYAPFRYTPEDFDARLDQIYADLVENTMFKPVRWESGEITWDAIVDYDEDDDPVWRERVFHIGRASDRAIAERFRQMAPLNLTDGAWLQNTVTAGTMDGVKSRLAAIWFDEAGNGRAELNHSNVYDTLLRSLNIYMPPVTSRDFIEQDFVPSAFESPVFQLCVGLFPQRFLPELLGLTLYVEWEATPTMEPIAFMMAARHIDPQYYRMHAAIDNINVGHGAQAKEAIKLYLHQKREEGGDSVQQEHWQRIWRGYVAWATLGNGANEVIERLMTVDRKQIHLRSSLLLASDILPPFLMALRAGKDAISTFLNEKLSSHTQSWLKAWHVHEPPPAELLQGVRADLNVWLKAGIDEKDRFKNVSLSAETRKLLKLKPKHGVDLIDLNRSLLEDAYPKGIARRAAFPDIKAHYAAKFADLVRKKAPLALQSHRRVPWVMKAFHGKPEDMLQTLIDRGLIDIEHPAHSPFFTKLEFSGPMYKAFTEEEKNVMMDSIEALRTGGIHIVQAEPETSADAENAMLDLVKRRSNEMAYVWVQTVAPHQNGAPASMPEWVEGRPIKLMEVFARTPSLVNPGDPSHSRFFEMISPSGRMADLFAAEEVATVEAWIAQGARVPDGAAHEKAIPIAAAAAAGADKNVGAVSEHSDPPQGSFGDKRWRIGMGAVH